MHSKFLMRVATAGLSLALLAGSAAARAEPAAEIPSFEMPSTPELNPFTVGQIGCVVSAQVQEKKTECYHHSGTAEAIMGGLLSGVSLGFLQPDVDTRSYDACARHEELALTVRDYTDAAGKHHGIAVLTSTLATDDVLQLGHPVFAHKARHGARAKLARLQRQILKEIQAAHPQCPKLPLHATALPDNEELAEGLPPVTSDAQAPKIAPSQSNAHVAPSAPLVQDAR